MGWSANLRSVAREYERVGYAVLRDVIAPELVDFLTLHLAMRSRVGALAVDAQVAGSSSVYGDPAFDALLASLVPAMSASVACDVLPTYSFVRIYRRGQVLVPHSDRPACENSMTLHLAASGEEKWPIWLRGFDGVNVAVDLAPGDAVIYRGCEVEHWREPCPADWFAQVFLHFVDGGGVHATQVFDRRAYLGLPRPRNVA